VLKSCSGDENLFTEASSSKHRTLINNTTAGSSGLLTDGETLLKTRGSGLDMSLLKGSGSRRSMPISTKSKIPNTSEKRDKIPKSIIPNTATREIPNPVDSDQLLYFGRVPINSTQIHEIRICNPSGVVMVLQGWTCESPFSTPKFRRRENVCVEPRSFILLPVAFVPKAVDVFYGALEVRWKGGQLLLRLVGESFDLTKTF
jgi:hypothetical protein